MIPEIQSKQSCSKTNREQIKITKNNKSKIQKVLILGNLLIESSKYSVY